MEIYNLLERKDIPDDVKELLKNFLGGQQEKSMAQALFEFSPDAITVTDLEFNVTHVNTRAVEIYGAKTAQEVIGMNALDFIVEDQRQKAIDNAMKTLKAGEKGFIFEYDLKKMDGSTYPAELFVSRLQNHRGQPIGFIGITRDISERKRAEGKIIESEKKYRSLVENINSGIFRVHVNEGLIQCNRAFYEMFGYTSFEEISQCNLSELYVNSGDRNKFIEELYLKGELFVQEVLMKRKDGSHFWASISSRVSPTREWHDGIIEDISTRKYAEKLIKQTKKEEEMFHAMLSHFLRNDLQKIVNNLDYLFFRYQQKKEIKRKDVDDIILIATRSSKIIDRVGKIFEVLQDSFEPKAIKKQISVLEIVNLLISKFDLRKVNFIINHKNLDFRVFYHKYLELAINEVIGFFVESNSKTESLVPRVIIEGLYFEESFCIIVQDPYSEPIPAKVCEKLVTKITERWEYHGHYIGLSLASVIMEHFGGKLMIHPSLEKGNEVQLWFPQTLLVNKRK